MAFLTPSSLKQAFSKIPSFSKTGRHSLSFLNMTQFFGVINDNVFKFVMAFLLIDALGPGKASSILSATGAVYVIPFLFFSSSAGILADRFSKQQLLVVMKSAEIIVMLLAIFAFGTKSVWGCYTLLFFLATHSAMFGPSKYGIIPELVPPDSVSKANGLITSFTYLAIIIGTFLASFLTEITNRHFTMIALFCLLIAIGGFISALGVKQTPAQGSNKTINFLFVREIYHTLKYCRSVHHLLPAIFGSAYFLFIGAFTQLNIIPFAMQSLNLSEIAGGYLFLATALGIAFGAFLAGKASRKRVELGISCLAGFGIALFFILITAFSSNIAVVTLCLVFIGILGGIFIVPFDTFIQLKSDTVKRGQTIAAANFLSFAGVLIASMCIYLFNQVFDLSSSVSFSVIGVLTLFLSITLTCCLSDLSIPFFSRTFLHWLNRYDRPDVQTIDQSTNTIIVIEKFSWKKALLLAGSLSNAHFLIPIDSKKWRWWLRFLYTFHGIKVGDNATDMIAHAKVFLSQQATPCILLDKIVPPQTVEMPRMFFDVFKRSSTEILYAHLIRDPKTNRQTFIFAKNS